MNPPAGQSRGLREAQLFMRVLTLITAFIASAAFAEPPTLRLSVPPRIVDGEAATATVTLIAEAGEFTGPELRMPGSLKLHIIPRSSHSERCVMTETSIPSGGKTQVTLKRGKSVTVQVDLLADYPIGLGPGQYVAVAQYWTADLELVRSNRIEFSIDRPTAASNAARYEAFLRTVSAVCRRESTAGEEALNFGQNYPDFLFTPALLSRAAMVTSATSTRRDIDALLQSKYPNTRFADAARRDVESLTAREEELKVGEEHRVQMAAWLADPQNEEAAAAFRALGTIIGTQQWPRYDEFMRRYADSPFAPDVLFAMVVAAQKGIMPPGKTPADRDALVRELKGQLIDRYPASMRAKQLKKTSAAH